MVGVISGFVNVLAGGGSFLTLPALIFLGLPAGVANGTNRIGILIQNIGAVWSFRRKGVFPAGLGLLLSVPAVIGAVAGARIAVAIGDAEFRKILALVMLGVTLISLWKPSGRTPLTSDTDLEFRGMRLTGLCLAFFFVGVYGGFVQAGVGFFVIAALTVVGLDLVRTNAVKLIVILILTLPALTVFLMAEKVNIAVGLLLGIGNFIGAYASTRVAIQKGHAWIRHFVTATVILMALWLLAV